MSRKDDIKRVIAALKKVPPAHLELIDLINETVKPDGELDYVKLGNMSDRVNLAEVQTASYIKGTRSATQALLTIPPFAKGVK